MARSLRLRKQTIRILSTPELRIPRGGIQLPQRATTEEVEGGSRCDCWISHDVQCNTGGYSDCNCGPNSDG